MKKSPLTIESLLEGLAHLCYAADGHDPKIGEMALYLGVILISLAKDESRSLGRTRAIVLGIPSGVCAADRVFVAPYRYHSSALGPKDS